MTSKSSEYPDPLEKPLDPDRVNYANGVLLDENDFKDEQTYFRGRLGRALTYLHGMGTVAGLEVITEVIEYSENGEKKEEHVIRVQPGLAIDRIGRLIELPVAYCLRAERWFEAQDSVTLQESFANSEEPGQPEVTEKAVVADLFIGFNNCGRGNTPYFGVGNVDATDAFTADRLRDSACLQLIVRPEIEKDIVTQKSPHHKLEDWIKKKEEEERPDGPPLSFEEKVNHMRKFKLGESWKNETTFWNKDANNINKPPEYKDGQNGTEVFLARVRLPATPDPITFDTQDDIKVFDEFRPLSYSAFELSWLIQATEKKNDD